MSDLIDRKKALDEISKIDTSIIPSGWVKGYVDETIKEIQRIIRTIPSAEPERKKGEWIYDTERVAGDGWTYSQYHCSECGFQELGGLANFCPNCGAYMKGDK